MLIKTNARATTTPSPARLRRAASIKTAEIFCVLWP